MRAWFSRRVHHHDVAHFPKGVTTELTIRYDILNLATDILTIRYEIFQLTGKTLTLNYKIRQLAGKALTFIYNSFGIIAKTLTIQYDSVIPFFLIVNQGDFIAVDSREIGDLIA